TGDAQAGSRSVFIVPLTAGNWAHRDPREGRGAPRDENRCRETREETLGSANLSTKRQRIAGLARTTAGTSSPPCASRQASHGRRPLRQRERNSPVKNRMRETCTSGSVRGGDGDIPTYSAPFTFDRVNCRAMLERGRLLLGAPPTFRPRRMGKRPAF